MGKVPAPVGKDIRRGKLDVFQGHLTGVNLGKLKNIVDDPQQFVAGIVNFAEVVV